MRLFIPLLSLLAGCAGPSSGALSEVQPVTPSPAHAFADSAVPDLVQYQEAPLVSAVRNGADGRSLIMGIWGDGRVVWSSDTIFGGAPYFEVLVDGDRLYGALHSFRRLFARWPGSVLEYHPEGASHVELVCTVGGEDRRLASWHESFETNSELVVTEHGVTQLDGRSREEVLASAGAGYRHFRVVWNDVRRMMRGLGVEPSPVPSEVSVVLPPPR